MKHNTLALSLALLSISAFGCASNPEPKVPQVPVEPPIVHCFMPPQDNFDKTAVIIANGTRWMWNEANHAWEVASSEDTKKKLTDAYQSAKEYVNNALKE